jgi:hypothetical protein
MFATWSASKRPASFAGCSRMQRMPSSMQTTCVTTPASTSITETGVSTPVSLFALVPALGSLLLVVVLLSLALSGLTGLACLVGLTKVPVPHTKQGD